MGKDKVHIYTKSDQMQFSRQNIKAGTDSKFEIVNSDIASREPAHSIVRI